MTRRSAAPTTKATAFFRQHRGFLPLKLRSRIGIAKNLARAEAEASARGWRCEWEGDPDGELEALGAVLRDQDGHVLVDRWGIVDPSRDAKRVVEAEMALEILEERR